MLQLLGRFWNHCFCASNLTENVASSFVQAAGRVSGAAEVLV